MLSIITKSTTALIPYERNPRKNDAAVDAVARSIRDFGFKNPVLIDDKDVVIAGHTRLKAAKRLGMKEVPCIVVTDLTPAQVRALRIADNSTSQIAEWDVELLRMELTDLPEFIFEDYGLTLSDLEDDTKTEPVEDDFDAEAAAAAITNPVTVAGDVWTLGRHRLLCGDCTDVAAVTKLVGKTKPTLCLTDPPYGLGDTVSDKNNYDVYEDSVDNLVALIKGFLPLAQKLCERVVLTPGNRRQYLYPTPTWTMAWFTPAGIGRGPWGFCCWQPILCYGSDPKLAHGLGSHPDAIVHTESAEDVAHPCSKPVKFWCWLLERTSQKSDTIFDPFAGSGTGIIAAEQTQRACIGIELSPTYCDVIVQRWEAFAGGKATRTNKV